MIFQIFADLFYAGSYIFVNLYVAGLITILSTIRCIIFYICDKKEYKKTIWLLPIFILGYALITIFFWTNYSDIVPLVTGILFTIAYILKDVQTIRYVTLIPNSMLIVYNIVFKTYSNAILDILETIVVIVSIVTFHRIRKIEKQNIIKKEGVSDGK
jgi:hypothetical protein